MSSKPFPLSSFSVAMMIRGLAILEVIGYHVRYLPAQAFVGYLQFLHGWAFNGVAAVWILFILSGFAQGRRYVADTSLSLSSVTSYYVGRIIRIFPLYYFVLVASWVVFRLYEKYPVDVFIRLMTFRGADTGTFPVVGHLWMISVLMPLYALTPFIGFVFKRFLVVGSFVWVPIAIMLWSFGLRLFFLTQHAPVEYSQWVATMYSPFIFIIDLYVFGMSLSFLFRSRHDQIKPPMKHRNHSLWIAVICVIVAGLFMSSKILHSMFIVDFSNAILLFAVYQPIVLMGCMWLILFSMERIPPGMNAQGWMTPLWAGLAWAGKHSYTWYALHVSVLYALGGPCNKEGACSIITTGVRYVWVVAICVATSIIVSALSRVVVRKATDTNRL